MKEALKKKNKIEKTFDIKTWKRYKHVRVVQRSLILALIAGIIIGLAISQLI